MRVIQQRKDQLLNKAGPITYMRVVRRENLNYFFHIEKGNQERATYGRKLRNKNKKKIKEKMDEEEKKGKRKKSLQKEKK